MVTDFNGDISHDRRDSQPSWTQRIMAGLKRTHVVLEAHIANATNVYQYVWVRIRMKNQTNTYSLKGKFKFLAAGRSSVVSQ